LKFYPGLVGGHCIGVDPYYLYFKAKELGIHAQIINSGRSINDSMGQYIGQQTVKKMICADKNVNQSRVLVMGATFKENVSDIRNSKVADVIYELLSFGVKVDVIDPNADSNHLKHEYGFGLSQISGKYDAIILAVNHKEYLNLHEDYFVGLSTEKGIFVDIKGVYRNKIKNLTYWSL
jgi:UDP-N-acetyl-D-galactosamine dehydrogenase